MNYQGKQKNLNKKLKRKKKTFNYIVQKALLVIIKEGNLKLEGILVVNF